MEYDQTWKQRTTPSGLQYWEHTASTRHISDKDYTGWPTPNATIIEAKSNVVKVNGRTPKDPQVGLADVAMLAGWPIPTTAEATHNYKDYHNKNQSLTGIAKALAGWNTSRATDGDHGGPNQTGGALPADAAKAGWSTPTVQDSNNTGGPSQFNRNTLPLNAEVNLAGWSTPTEYEDRRTVEIYQKTSRTMERADLSIQVRSLVSGPTQSGFPAQTEKRGGVLNPVFSAWLMGFPLIWTLAGLKAGSHCAKKSKTG